MSLHDDKIGKRTTSPAAAFPTQKISSFQLKCKPSPTSSLSTYCSIAQMNRGNREEHKGG